MSEPSYEQLGDMASNRGVWAVCGWVVAVVLALRLLWGWAHG